MRMMAGVKSAFLSGLAAVFLITGCASTQPGEQRSELKTNSDQSENQRRAQIRMQLAVGYFQQGQLRVALDEVKQALQLDPNLADAYSLRALIYMEMGETALAEESFQRAMRLAPNNPDLSNNYGWFLCQTGKEKQSIAHFEAALNNRAYQSPAKALNNAGVCSLKSKDLESAARYLTAAFGQDPGNLDTNANLAKLHYARGDYQQARFYIARATKADTLSADVLWTAIKVERKLGNRPAETSFVTQLRRRHPNSPELAAYLRGAFDE
jgi:type IV pilus assembly protein PilF